jgi:large subunit ribosomal protein L22
MGKPAHPRPLSESQARAVGRNIRVSPRKLNLVAQSIRGKSAESALTSLTFTPKRIARDVKKILQSAIANAENNHDLDVDDLIVSEASVGKNLTMKRFRARARGRAGRIEKPFSQITIVVEEKRALEAAKNKQKAVKSTVKPASKKTASAKQEDDSTTKIAAVEKAPEKKSAPGKPATQKAPATKAPAQKAPAKKSPAKKATATKASAEKSAAKKTTTKKQGAAQTKAAKRTGGTKKSPKGKETE